MTTKNIKIVMFGALLVAMILPFSGMNFAEGQTPTDNEKRFNQFLKLNEKQGELKVKLKVLIHDDGADSKIKKIEKQIDKIQKKMDKLQNLEIESVAISPQDMAALEAQGEIVINEVRNPNSENFINENASYFVNEIKRSIVVTISEDDIQGDTFQRSAAVQAIPTSNSLGSIDYEIDVVRKNTHFIICGEREANCNYGIGGIAIKAGSITSTLGFSAVQTDGDTGFVTVAHGVGSVGSSVNQYPTRTVGNVDTKDTGTCDCAFVETTGGLDTVYKVYTGLLPSPITSYATSGNPSVGTWLMMSGVGSEVEYGQYQGWHPTFQAMATDYTSQNGDSGAPVTTIGYNVKLYGMHHSSGTYGYATPYITLKTQLSLQ